MLRAGWPAEKIGIWLEMPLTMRDAEVIATAADVPLAALYLPDPSRWEMLKAWIKGARR